MASLCRSKVCSSPDAGPEASTPQRGFLMTNKEFHFMTERNLILCSTKSHFMLHQSHFMLYQSHFMSEPTS